MLDLKVMVAFTGTLFPVPQLLVYCWCDSSAYSTVARACLLRHLELCSDVWSQPEPYVALLQACLESWWAFHVTNRISFICGICYLQLRIRVKIVYNNHNFMVRCLQFDSHFNHPVALIKVTELKKWFGCLQLPDVKLNSVSTYARLKSKPMWNVMHHLKWLSILNIDPGTLTRAVLGGGRFYAPPPQVFRRYLKNGGAQRRRFWHTLSYIFSA